MGVLNINYIETKNNNVTIEVNGYLLHSKYNPVKEAEKFLEKELNQQQVNIIFGLGKGYLSDAIQKLDIPKEKVLFIEPIQEFEVFSQRQYDVLYGFDIEKIQLMIESKLKYFSRKIKVICAPNYDKLFSIQYLELLQKVKEIQNLNIVYNNTVQGLSNVWQENTIHNNLYINKAHSLNALKQYYHCPIIVASGGPSLIKQLSLLQKVRESVILIAAGSTINTLLKYHIEPDYVISIDGSEGNYTQHFKDLDLKKTQLFFSSTSHYKIQKYYKNSQFSFLDTREERLHSYLSETYQLELPQILGGGSVANFSLSIARFLTTGPIALIGQDLAYTNGQTHAEGNKNFKQANDEFLKRQDAFEIEGYYGDKVMTDFSLFSMKESFEDILQQIENKETIFNCTEGGLKIKLMNQIPFIEFCEKFVDFNEKVTMYKNEAFNPDYAKVAFNFRREIGIYKSIIVEIKLALQALKKNTLNTEFAPSIIKTLDSVDKKIAKLMKKAVMERINDPITIDVMTKYEAPNLETAEERYIRVYKQNLELYERLLAATEQTILYTKDVLAEIEQLMEA
ncbi:uncharacterized protein SSIL_3279 [Solibacillus silvestris StLB046]|uniref:6-hydroxymethylpterin diphosphokinase MptE-like domain-containing protein n=1 Tax=Solibacillus silvestris (strain StLB046) TaxID=1002809 RepID=F2F314_SOLSS|nr:6-hydroxymethylpterin diphosphokinase MptE-like protein [Solibacillus silvestris]BAK17702.1 uncharacterized protein SSIL_3279 [Solibacillus silvestris StLB046]